MGDKTYTIALGKDSAYKDAENVVDLTDFEADTLAVHLSAGGGGVCSKFSLEITLSLDCDTFNSTLASAGLQGRAETQSSPSVRTKPTRPRLPSSSCPPPRTTPTWSVGQSVICALNVNFDIDSANVDRTLRTSESLVSAVHLSAGGGAAGEDSTKDIDYTVKAGDDKTAVAKGLIDAINADADLKGLFKASGSDTGIVMEALEAGHHQCQKSAHQ